MKKIDTVWIRAPHTEVKHLILRGYLGAWYPKLAWTGRVLFIDGFAGPGEYVGGIPGSPLIAIEAAIKHKGDLSKCELVYIFVEQDAKRHTHLEALLKAQSVPSNVKWHAVKGDFADEVTSILDNLEKGNKKMASSFVMVDPFGWKGMPLSVLARIAEHPRSELLVSFMYESINRWANHPQHEPTFDSLFGCSDWRDVEKCVGADDRKRFLLGLYVYQLKNIGFPYVRPFEMIDAGNKTEYFLIFASQSIHGLKAIKAAMWAADPSGHFQFSDASSSGQLVLIKPEPDYDMLRTRIVSKFQGNPARIEDIEEFVLAETAYRETHFKRQILAKMEKDGELQVTESPRKKRFTYPSGTIILIH